MALQVKTFRITDSASESAVNQFLQGKRVEQWTASYSGDPTLGFWNLLVGYREDFKRHEDGKPQRKESKEKKERMEHVPDLPAELLPLYDDIRKWRNQRAREEKEKPYLFFNNKQLEDLVKEKPASLEALKAIVTDMSAEHFEKYGNELLGALSSR
jgi:superfamily II DNA helicase RecQ